MMQSEKGKITIKAGQGMTQEITFLSPDIVRCRAWWGDTEPKADTYISEWEIQDGDETAVDEQENVIRIQGSRVLIEIEKGSGKVSCQTDENVILQEAGKKAGYLELCLEDDILRGLGQQQEALEGYNGKKIELLHKNTSITVPFVISSRGYAVLWNSSSAGIADFTKSRQMSFQAYGGSQTDYLVFLGNPLQVVQRFWELTGPGRMLPKWAFGFWQSKMRYTTQEELLKVAETYREKNYPVDIIVVDFYHWTQMGDFTFDRKDWPDPEGMLERLKQLHIKCMVSVWPHVSTKSVHYEAMKERGFFLKNGSGDSIVFTLFNGDDNGLYDVFSKAAGEFLFQKARGYYLAGAKVWWLDGCEPEVPLDEMDEKQIMTADGPLKERVLAYPLLHARTFYEGQRSIDKNSRVISFARSTFAGAQKYGVCVWSGDVGHDFAALRSQIAAGLSAAVSGLPFWTTDIGGFTGGNPEDEAYRELNIRWFQYGVFCPIFRVHGSRGALNEDDLLYGISRGENELWSFGKEAEKILVMYDRLRYLLLPYIYTQAHKTTAEGIPMMQPLYLRHEREAACWEIRDQYYFGESLMVCPVVYEGARGREVYFPGEENWYDFWTGECYMPGRRVWIPAGTDRILLFVREHAMLLFKEVEMYTDENRDAVVYAAVYGDTAEGIYYNDDGETYDYEQGDYEEIRLCWQDGTLQTEALNQREQKADFRLLKGAEITAFICRNIEQKEQI